MSAAPPILIHDSKHGPRSVGQANPPFGWNLSGNSSSARGRRGQRMTAAEILGELRSKSAVPALIDATRDPELDWIAATSLGEIRRSQEQIECARANARSSSGRSARGTPPIDHLDRRGRGGLRARRFWANRAASRSCTEPCKSTEWVWRRMAVGARQTLDPAAVPLLITALHDQHANVRVAAAQELGKIADPSAYLASGLTRRR